MVSEIYSDYMLVNFDHSRKWDAEFLSALEIYVAETPAHIRTDTNEIAYWRQEYSRRFPNDALLIFGLYNAGKLIGFCEAVFIKCKSLLFVDYMCIDRAYRKNNVFFQFLEMVRAWLIKHNIHYDYVVTEVSLPDDSCQARRNNALIRALEMSGFFQLNFDYEHPRLGENCHTERRAKLLIKPSHEVETISRLEAVSIIKALYQDHYSRWYEGVLPPSAYAEYKAEIKLLIEAIDAVDTKEILSLISSQPEAHNDDTVLRTTDSKKIFIYFLLAPFAVAASSAGGLFYMKSKFGISVNDIVAIVLVSIVATIALSAFAIKRSVSAAIEIIKAIIGISQK